MIKILQIILCLLLPLFINAAERVVSLSPAVTELVIYAGGKGQLCARSSACTMPEVNHLPVAGDLGLPFVEAVLKNRATLVLTDIYHPQSQWDLLRRCGVKIELLDNRQIDSLPGNVRKIGSLLSLPDAGNLASALQNRITELRKSRPAKPVKAVIVFGVSPLVSCGKDTFISAAMELAGVENAAASAGQGYFILTPEFLLAAAPEYIFVIGIPETVVQEFFNRGIFRNLPVVRQKKIIILPADKWSRLTPELISAIGELRTLLAGQN